ncbi:unnamed protein product [Gadus morhua 'NCC']
MLTVPIVFLNDHNQLLTNHMSRISRSEAEETCMEDGQVGVMARWGKLANEGGEQLSSAELNYKRQQREQRAPPLRPEGVHLPDAFWDIKCSFLLPVL